MTGIVTLALLLAWQVPSPTASQALAHCEVSDDPTYGYAPENPVQVGGGAMYVAARERRYLDALRGPAGEPIRYKRLGSMKPPSGDHILDHYELTYDGLDKPISLYLDAYHYFDQRAPRGLNCGQPIGLQPLPDMFATNASLTALARERVNERDLAPIPLDSDGKATHGAVWDSFRTMALGSRTPGTAIVAYPLTCETGTVMPVSIELVNTRAGVPEPTGIVKDAAIESLLPTVTVPAGSIATRVPLQQPRFGDAVRITYSDAACPDSKPDVLLPLTLTQGRVAEVPPVPLPEGDKTRDPRVLIHVFVDLDGSLQKPQYLGGPAHLERAALESLKTVRGDPPRINGAPVVGPMIVVVRFRAP